MAMPPLRELQHLFAAEVLAGSDAVPAFASALGARERLAVYRRTIHANYRNALTATYPAVRRIVGATFFLTAVDEYVEAHPSRSGDLNEYGDAFGDFLGRYPKAAELPYLPDVARLEWAIDEANRAADSPFAPDRVLGELSRSPADELPHLRLRVEPSCRLHCSAFPLLRIWQVNAPDHVGDLTVDFAAGPDHLRIRRTQGDSRDGIAIERLGKSDFHWLAALAAGATLAEAIEQALNADATFDLQAALRRFVGDGTIGGIKSCAQLTRIDLS